MGWIGHKCTCIRVLMVDGWEVRLNVITPSHPCWNIHGWNSYPNCSKRSLSSTQQSSSKPTSYHEQFEEVWAEEHSLKTVRIPCDGKIIRDIGLVKSSSRETCDWISEHSFPIIYHFHRDLDRRCQYLRIFLDLYRSNLPVESYLLWIYAKGTDHPADEANIYLSCKIWLVRSGGLGRAPRKLWGVYSHPTLY